MKHSAQNKEAFLHGNRATEISQSKFVFWNKIDFHQETIRAEEQPNLGNILLSMW